MIWKNTGTSVKILSSQKIIKRYWVSLKNIYSNKSFLWLDSYTLTYLAVGKMSVDNQRRFWHYFSSTCSRSL